MEELDTNSSAILEAASSHILAGASKEQMSVLDVGCGRGLLLQKLANEGVRHLAGVGWQIQAQRGIDAYSGIDLSSVGWSERLEGRSFDWVVSTEVLEHLVNPFQYLLEMRNLLKPDGKLLLTFPNVHNWRSIVGYMVNGRFSGFFGHNFNSNHPLHDQHIFIPNRHLVAYFLHLAGFNLQSVSWVNGNRQLTAQTTMWTATLGTQVSLV